jgi:NAD(P)-dependent dehydrogenase (short-subunit alcohol dehydrogenase family)
MPDDIARMTLWLASDDSRMVTAQYFVVDAARREAFAEPSIPAPVTA